jgi:hypothetical protein
MLDLTRDYAMAEGIAPELAIQYSDLSCISQFELLPEPLVGWIQNQGGLKIDGKPTTTNEDLVLSFRLLSNTPRYLSQWRKQHILLPRPISSHQKDAKMANL